MSLNVYLRSAAGTCPTCGHSWEGADVREVYSANITHNLGKMANAAGIYEALWRPEEINITTASQLIPLLKAGLDKLKSNPEHYKTFNALNGWGMYEHFVPFVEKYLRACEEHPTATVVASR